MVTKSLVKMAIPPKSFADTLIESSIMGNQVPYSAVPPATTTAPKTKNRNISVGTKVGAGSINSNVSGSDIEIEANAGYDNLVVEESKYQYLLDKVRESNAKKQNEYDMSLVGLNAIQELAAKGSQPLLDISPITSWVDSVTGSNLTPYVAKSASQEDRIKLIATLQNEVDKNRQAKADADQEMSALELRTKIEMDQQRANNLYRAQQLNVKLAGMPLSMMEADVKAEVARMKGAEKVPVPVAKEYSGREEAFGTTLRGIQDVAKAANEFGLAKTAKSWVWPREGTPAFNTIMGKLSLIVSGVAKGFEGGRVSDADRIRYEKAIGGSLDSPDKIINVLQWLAEDMAERATAYYDNMSLANIPGFSDAYRDKNSSYKNFLVFSQSAGDHYSKFYPKDMNKKYTYSSLNDFHPRMMKPVTVSPTTAVENAVTKQEGVRSNSKTQKPQDNVEAYTYPKGMTPEQLEDEGYDVPPTIEGNPMGGGYDSKVSPSVRSRIQEEAGKNKPANKPQSKKATSKEALELYNRLKMQKAR